VVEWSEEHAQAHSQLSPQEYLARGQANVADGVRIKGAIKRGQVLGFNIWSGQLAGGSSGRAAQAASGVSRGLLPPAQPGHSFDGYLPVRSRQDDVRAVPVRGQAERRVGWWGVESTG